MTWYAFESVGLYQLSSLHQIVSWNTLWTLRWNINTWTGNLSAVFCTELLYVKRWSRKLIKFNWTRENYGVLMHHSETIWYLSHPALQNTNTKFDWNIYYSFDINHADGQSGRFMHYTSIVYILCTEHINALNICDWECFPRRTLLTSVMKCNVAFMFVSACSSPKHNSFQL
jgi:hypothetical protein